MHKSTCSYANMENSGPLNFHVTERLASVRKYKPLHKKGKPKVDYDEIQNYSNFFSSI